MHDEVRGTPLLTFVDGWQPYPTITGWLAIVTPKSERASDQRSYAFCNYSPVGADQTHPGGGATSMVFSGELFCHYTVLQLAEIWWHRLPATRNTGRYWSVAGK